MAGRHLKRNGDPESQQTGFRSAPGLSAFPAKTAADTKESLDLLFALRGPKWACNPTLFVPLEETRLERRGHQSQKLVELTDLQWEFFFTCCDITSTFSGTRERCTGDQPRHSSLLLLAGRKLFGQQVKVSAVPLAHIPERLLRRKTLLGSANGKPKYSVPERVEVPSHDMRPIMPEAY
jgi:hypothetical protein